MEPLQPVIPEEKPGLDGTTDVTPQPGATFQPVIISPSESTGSTPSVVSGAAATVTPPDTTLSQATGSSSPSLSQPAVAKIPSSPGIVSAWPTDFQNPAQSNSVPSISVPQRGSLTSASPIQSQPNPVAAAMPAPTAITTAQQPAITAANPAPQVVSSVSTPAETHAQVVTLDGTHTPRPSRKRNILMLGGGVTLVLALMAAVVFGWYLPNTSASVYNTGINRSGKALNTLVTSATDAKQLEAYNTSTINGSVVANLDGGKYSGDFTTTFDKTTMNGGLDVKLTAKDSATKTLNIKAMSQIPTGSIYPDVYFQVIGMKTLGFDDYAPGLSDYDGKWISVSSDYLKTLSSDYGVKTGDNTKDQVTAADMAELAHAGVTVTQQYLFSTAPDKAVFEKKSFVGKESMDGLNTYHYKVGVNVDHAQAYCVALSNAVYSTAAYKKLTGETDKEIADDKASAAKDCPNAVKDEVSSSDTFDLWVDGKYKLIHKIRIYDKKDKKSYTDVGQTYLGGSKLSLFSNFHEDVGKTDGKFTLDTDFKAAKTSGELYIKSTNQDYPYDVTVKVNAEASSKKVEFNKPASSIPLQDILKKFGLDPSGGTDPSPLTPPPGSTQGKATDVNNETNLKALNAYLEAAYADNGYYPTLAQLNNAKWRAANMKGLADTALRPPGSTVTTLATSASATQYGYAPSKCTSDGCQDFTLSTLLSTGETYKLQSANADVGVGSAT
jgi:hypothetical protein